MYKMQIFEDIYKNGGDDPQNYITCDDNIDREIITVVESDILPKLTYRADYNGRPRMLKTPTNRVFLIIHPTY